MKKINFLIYSLFNEKFYLFLKKELSQEIYRKFLRHYLVGGFGGVIFTSISFILQKYFVFN
jgi:hypothetical protein